MPPPSPPMFKVSRDNPAYWLTSVTHNRLSIFQRDEFKKIVTDAYNEAREKHKFLIFGYVIMPDHSHAVTDNAHEIKDILRYLNGVSANKIIKHLKLNGHEESLAKLRIQERPDKHKHSVYEHHPNAMRITGEDALMQKINYIHLNPVRAGLVDHPDDYLYSSARLWHGRVREDEPLVTDHKQIAWRWSGGIAAMSFLCLSEKRSFSANRAAEPHGRRSRKYRTPTGGIAVPRTKHFTILASYGIIIVRSF